MTLYDNPEWSAQFWECPDSGMKFTIFVNERTGEYRRYPGFLGLKAMEGPPDSDDYEVPVGDQWVLKRDITSTISSSGL